MKRKVTRSFYWPFFLKVISLSLIFLLVGKGDAFARKRPLTFVDVMKFKAIREAKISDKGRWLVYEAWPDRGDGEVVVLATDRAVKYVIPRGTEALVSLNGQWVACRVQPPVLELEEAKKKGQAKPKSGMALLNTATGEILQWEKVKDFAFSKNGEWLVYQYFPDTEAKEKRKENRVQTEKNQNSAQTKQKETSLTLRHLASGREFHFSGIHSFALAPDSHFLAVVVQKSKEKEKVLLIYDLQQMAFSGEKVRVFERRGADWSELSWWKKGPRLAFLGREEAAQSELSQLSSRPQTPRATPSPRPKELAESMCLYVWDAQVGKLVKCASRESILPGWVIPRKNSLRWSNDGQRVFFGVKPEKPARSEDSLAKSLNNDSSQVLKGKNASPKKEQSSPSEENLYDLEAILAEREVDVWHWNDPYIIPHQKKIWPKVKDKTYSAVYHLSSGKIVQLADLEMPEVRINENPYAVLGISNLPYRKEVTWAGRFSDLYLIRLQDGQKTKVATRIGDQFSLSPSGKMVVYFQKGHWYLYDSRREEHCNLTKELSVSFANEDHDYPRQPPSYGLAGWLAGDEGILIYDKYDVWFFPASPHKKPLCLTAGQGRREKIIFRVVKTDPEKKFFRPGEKLLLSSYRELEKNFGFYELQLVRPGVKKLLEERKKFKFIAQARHAPKLLYTQESYEEFPDIWITDTQFKNRRKLTEVNPQMKDFLWGKAELVSWRSLDGIPLQGVLIKPGDYVPGKRYPVIVYFYRFFSQRLYEFNQPVVNHRPCFPLYTSNGYALFLPDIRFEVGRPGFSATKCLVPGVQKLIEMGIADPKAIGLHGHSWSGYQTAFIITQTNIFACAIAGAPVSNMTSAYSGIRWGSGLARQFQYEKTQSRIGGSLWEFPERYFLNSPVFFAEWIKTPLLIMFGDEDGAVPWYQGIELYLALRRLGKNCIFLQYRGEPHHLQKYPNKLDYALKMKQFFDHYLKGFPAPEWITRGVPYQGK